jgi:tRNA uridine 5-carbamoylmethylation protein Kti12
MFEKRISIFTGHFGSGKTEVAVNYARKLAETGARTAIADFDIVNPFFRTADARQALEDCGIHVITPVYANTNVDVPSLPPEINTLFEKKDYRVVLDVGGDDLGARVLSRYREDILQDDYELLLVVNTRRIMTDTVEKIEEMLHSIEQSARLKVTGLVNNTNLLRDTSAKDILQGQKLVLEVSRKLSIPVVFTAGFEQPLSEARREIDSEVLCLDKLIKLPWD